MLPFGQNYRGRRGAGMSTAPVSLSSVRPWYTDYLPSRDVGRKGQPVRRCVSPLCVLGGLNEGYYWGCAPCDPSGLCRPVGVLGTGGVWGRILG